MNKIEYAIAPFLVLLIGKLTKWTIPIGGGDPVYLNGKEAGALAAEGIAALTMYLPEDVAKSVVSALGGQSSAPRERMESKLSLTPESVVFVGSPGDAPGCCVKEGNRLICVR